MAIPEKGPARLRALEFGRHSYVCDPGATLAKNQRAAVRRLLQRPSGEPRRIATSGTYRARDDVTRGLVRQANWCGQQRGWKEIAFPCPPNVAARVIGTLAPMPGKRGRRGNIEVTSFARALRSR